MRSKTISFLLAVIATVLICGCTNGQLGRAESMASTTHSLLAEAEAHVSALEEQLAAASKAAAESGDARIMAVVEQLRGAVTVAKTYLPALRTSAEQADIALASIRATGQSDVPWWKVALGIAVPLLLPLAKGIPVVGPLIGQLGEAAWQIYSTRDQKNQQDAVEAQAKALAQTVAGIEAAKETMQPDQVAKLHAALSTEQDKSVKGTIALVRATLAGLLLSFLAIAPASGAEVGLGPSPIAGSATVDSSAITDGSIVNADVNASAAIAGTKVAPDFGSQNIATTGNIAINTSNFTVAGATGNTAVAGTLTVSGATTNTVTDAGTGNALNVLTIRHASSGTPSNDFGVQLKFNADSSTNSNRQQLDIFTGWNTPTDASRAAGAYFRIFDTAAREFMRVAADGAAARIGFLGTTAAAQQGAEIDADTALATFGLKATASGMSTARSRCKIATGINLNSANTDVSSFTGMPAKYFINAFWMYDASTSLTTCTFDVRTATAGAGTALVSAYAPTNCTAATKIANPTRASIATTDYQTASTLTIRCVTAQGSAATATLIIQYLDFN